MFLSKLFFVDIVHTFCMAVYVLKPKHSFVTTMLSLFFTKIYITLFFCSRPHKRHSFTFVNNKPSKTAKETNINLFVISFSCLHAIICCGTADQWFWQPLALRPTGSFRCYSFLGYAMGPFYQRHIKQPKILYLNFWNNHEQCVSSK